MIILSIILFSHHLILFYFIIYLLIVFIHLLKVLCQTESISLLSLVFLMNADLPVQFPHLNLFAHCLLFCLFLHGFVILGILIRRQRTDIALRSADLWDHYSISFVSCL